MALDGTRGRRSLPRSRRAAWALLVGIPFAVSACVTVTQDGAAPVTPAPITSPSPTPRVTPPPRPTAQPTPEPVEAHVFGFLPNWQLAEATLALDPGLLTTVTWHGIEASGEGRLVAKKPNGDVPPGWAGLETDAFATLQATLQDAGVDVVVTIQRFGWTEGTMKRTENLLTTPRARRRLAARIADLVIERRLDGVNLDFEPLPAELADEFVELVRGVRAALDEVGDGLHLSVDVHSSLTGYDLPALTADDAADVAIIMAYDYRGDDAGIAASLAPLVDPNTTDITTSVEAALAQVPGDRLILGLPWYGRAWSTESDEPRAATVRGEGIDRGTTVPYSVAVEQAEVSGRRYDPATEAAWTVYPTQSCRTCEAVWRQIWYEDPDSFGAKIDYALEQGLAGVGMWALGHEAGREELWWALRNRLDRRVDEAPPNGTASLDPTATTRDRDGLPVVSGSAPLRLFAADDAEGSGLAFVRVGASPDLDGDGRLTTGRTYPASDRLEFALGDPETGGSPDAGPRSVHVQWRDLAGNWSLPVAIDVWAEDPDGPVTLADAG